MTDCTGNGRRCGCFTHRVRRSQIKATWRARAESGQTEPLIPKELVEATLPKWLDHGYTLHSIAGASGVGLNTIKRIQVGDNTGGYTSRVANGLFALTHHSLIAATPDQALVPSIGATRRLQALAWMGHPAGRLLGRGGTSLVRGDQAGRCTASTHRIVDDLFEQLQMTDLAATGDLGARRAARRARTLGWAPPLAWTEDDIDNPDVGPAELFRPARANRVDYEAFGDNVEFLLSWGYSPVQVVAQLFPVDYQAAAGDHAAVRTLLARTEQRLRRGDRFETSRAFRVKYADDLADVS